MDDEVELITEWPVSNSLDCVRASFGGSISASSPKGEDANSGQNKCDALQIPLKVKQLKDPELRPLNNVASDMQQTCHTACRSPITDSSTSTNKIKYSHPEGEDATVPVKFPRLCLSGNSFGKLSVRIEESDSETCKVLLDDYDQSYKSEFLVSSSSTSAGPHCHNHYTPNNVNSTVEECVEIEKIGDEVDDGLGDSELEPEELLAQPRLARWWRRHGQRLAKCQAGEPSVTLPDSINPNTLLFHVARMPAGRAFLREEVSRLQRRGERRGQVQAALGSILQMLGSPQQAARHLIAALQAEPQNKDWQWLLHKAEQQCRIRAIQGELQKNLSFPLTYPSPQEVDRVSYKDLSFVEFFQKYALRRKPVIITDFVDTMTTVPWDLQHIRDKAGGCLARVKKCVPGSVEWAGLEESKSLTVSQFLDDLHRCHDYLFDWSLPLHCPQLAQEITIPKYFAGDFLQRTSAGSLYQDSWPSLFVAPAGVHGALHVDAFASNFWMALFQGAKRWTFFREEDSPCLYPEYAQSLDPVFQVNVTQPDLDQHPLLSLVHPMHCTLNAGEILFVPAGCPHIVHNLTPTLAISSNFVDLSNQSRVLRHLRVNALQDPRAADLIRQLEQPGFVNSMRPDMTDLPWKRFKSWPPASLEAYSLDEVTVEQWRKAGHPEAEAV